MEGHQRVGHTAPWYTDPEKRWQAMQNLKVNRTHTTDYGTSIVEELTQEFPSVFSKFNLEQFLDESNGGVLALL